MQQIAIATLVVVMMVAIGLRTEPHEFRAVIERRWLVVVMMLVNTVLIPLAVWGLVTAASLPTEVAIGLMLCAASPGGATGPLFATQARGHTALAVATMVLLAMLSVLTAPPTMALVAGSSDVGSAALVLPMMGTLVVFQLVPLVGGMAIRRWFVTFANRVSGPANAAATVLLLLVVVGLLITKGHVLLELSGTSLAACVGMVVLCLGVGALLSRDAAMRRSLSMVTGVRNLSLALLLSASWFPDPLTDATILSFGLFCMIIPFVVAVAWRSLRPIDQDAP